MFAPDEKAGGATLIPMAGYDAVLLLSFGGPEGPDDVVPFLENVTAGRGIPRERLVEVGAHYTHFGGVSPINEQCRRIQQELAEELRERGRDLPVYWGNRNWHPFLTATLRDAMAHGHKRLLAVVTSAYSSYSACRQYLDDIEQARAEIGDGAPTVDKVRAFYNHPGFIESFVDGTNQAIDTLGADANPTILFTAHSIPNSMAASSDYQTQLVEAARLVTERLSPAGQDRPRPWRLCWQSRSGPPTVPWLEPDVNDEIRTLADSGGEHAVIVPIGFVSDHIEVLWDLDVEAAATATEAGVTLARSSTPGTLPDPGFIEMLAELIEERLDDSPLSTRRALGSLTIRPDRCAVDCCPAPSRPSTTGRA